MSDYKIELRGDTYVVVYSDGTCRPACKDELETAARIEELKADRKAHAENEMRLMAENAKLKAKLAAQEEATRRVSEYNGRLEAELDRLESKWSFVYRTGDVMDHLSVSAKERLSIQDVSYVLDAIHRAALEEKGDG